MTGIKSDRPEAATSKRSCQSMELRRAKTLLTLTVYQTSAEMSRKTAVRKAVNL